MASIHRERDKPNWFCHYYDPEGFRRNRSTGTDNARVAKTICSTVDRASSLARDNKLSNEKGLKLIRDTCAAIEETHGKLAANRAHDVLKGYVEEFIKIGGGELESYTVRTWLETWVASRTDTSKATQLDYSRTKDLFVKYLGTRADRPLTTLQPKQVEEFKLELNKRVAPSTVNKAIKILKASFNTAVAKRQIDFSPAEYVSSLEVDECSRRPFTDGELGKILKVANVDWYTMILLGYYTGLRLGDCANLTWRNIELHKETINIQTEKTGRRQILPVAEPLNRQLQKLAGDNPDAPLCPTLNGKKASWLSAQFYAVMVSAGLVEKRDHQSTGKGRDGKRDTAKISFHSLRYNTTSALKSAGVSDSVAMDIVGHETASVSRNYTKIDDSAKRAAINKLPDITAC
jgi:integrase